MSSYELPIAQIDINVKSRDDTPAVLPGLKRIHMDETLRAKVFALLEAHILPDADRGVGRPGMPLWRMLVPGVVKQGLNCDCDRLHELANGRRTLRRMPGRAEWPDSDKPCNRQTIIGNVSLPAPELLAEIGRLGCRKRPRGVWKKAWCPRCAAAATRSRLKRMCIIPPM